MKRLFACLLLAALVVFSGCAGQYYRGMDAEGHFVSTVSPQVRVAPAQGFENVLSGCANCLVKVKDFFMATVPVQVWYGMSVRDGAQLIMLLADCQEAWEWSISSHGADYENYRILRERRGIAAGEADVVVFVRPAALDPFRSFSGEKEQDLLVAQYSWINASANVKQIVEYREPAPASSEALLNEPEDVTAFLDRAGAAFSREQFLDSPKPGQHKGGMPADDTLSRVLGVVEQPTSLSVF